ncbi:MAG: hypothetical protein ACXAEU_14480 [Candidatus Hodarchaeales archaeon]|jgi:hypothetical protein
MRDPKEKMLQDISDRWRRALHSIANKEEADTVNDSHCIVDKVTLGEVLAEYTLKEEDLIYHFFVKKGRYWTLQSKDIITQAMIKGLRLENKVDKLMVEWIGELYSWCIIVKGIATVSNPPKDMIEAPLSIVKEAGDLISVPVRQS